MPGTFWNCTNATGRIPSRSIRPRRRKAFDELELPAGGSTWSAETGSTRPARRADAERRPRRRRRREPRRIDSSLRTSRRAPRSARLRAPSATRRCRRDAHGITDDDLKRLPASLVGGPVAESSSNAFEAIEKLRRVYCSTTGFDYSHVFVPEERDWLRHAAESGRFLPPMDPASTEALLDRITQVEVFERFLHRTFPGKTRFSVEGVDMLVPMLDEIICRRGQSRERATRSSAWRIADG